LFVNNRGQIFIFEIIHNDGILNVFVSCLILAGASVLPFACLRSAVNYYESINESLFYAAAPVFVTAIDCSSRWLGT